MAQIHLAFLGGYSVTIHKEPVQSFPTDKARALLAYLALEADRAHSRSSLAGLLWPDILERPARGNLRNTLYRLRRTLDHAAPGTSERVLSVTRRSIQFQATAACCDARTFQARLDAVTTHQHESLADCDVCLRSLQEAAALYRGELLQGLNLPDAPGFEEWLLLRREYLHHLALRALSQLADILEARQDLETAYGVAVRLVALDPYREEGQRRAMRLLARQGLPDRALAQLEALRKLLREELGVEPDGKTIELARQIAAGAFDGETLVAPRPVPPAAPAAHSDWSEAPLVGPLFGRSAELQQMRQWLRHDRCQVVALLGLGGVGKSALAAHTARAMAGEFEAVLWRSLLNAPPLDEILVFAIESLSGQAAVDLPESLDEKLDVLLDHLRRQRCLLVLDNVETVMLPQPAGRFRPSCEAYRQLIQRLGKHEHQSCLLLTSREQPEGLARLQQRLGGVRSLVLVGLDVEAGRALLRAQGLDVAEGTAAQLTRRYSGNPLALNLVAHTIQDLYAGDAARYLIDDAPIFADIRQVLDQQLGRLSPLERDILFWLATAREPLSPRELKESLVGRVSQRELLEALGTLQRRSLLERRGGRFTLQNVVTEYLTRRLAEKVSREIEAEQLDLTHRLALLHAQAPYYVQQVQIRLILEPIGDRLAATRGRRALEMSIRRILESLRQHTPRRPGYAAGNLLNLSLQLGLDLTGADFSHLCVWQAELQGMELRGIDLTGSDMTGSVFVDTFGLVWSVAVSPDGELVAAGTADGHVRLWQWATGQPMTVWRAQETAVYSVAFSPDGQLLASGGAEGRICLWRVHGGRLARTLEGHLGAIQHLAFSPATTSSPGGRLLASASDDGTVRLWDVACGQVRHVLEGHTDFVLCAAFHPNGGVLASGARDRTVRLWDVQSGQPLGTLDGHEGWVTCVAFNRGGRTLASASEDGTIRLWDRGDRQLLATLAGHEGGIQALAFGADGRTLASGGNDHTVRLWDLSRERERHILHGHTNWVRAVAFSPDDQTLVSGGWDHSLRWWDVQSGRALRTSRGHAPSVFGVAFSPDGKTVASASSDSVVRIWDVESGEVVHDLLGHSDWVWRVAFCPAAQAGTAGNLLASAGMDGVVRLWHPQTGRPGPVLRTHQDGLQALTFSPGGRWLASGDLGGRLLLTDVDALVGPGMAAWSRQRLVQLRGHANWCLSAAFDPGGDLLASGGADGVVILWDVRSCGMLRTLEGHTRGVQEVAFSPDGSLLASASWDHTVRMWDVASGQVRNVLEGHSDIAQGVAFHPNGTILASSSYDGTVRLWDVASGEVRDVLRGHSNWVHHVTFSLDGRLLASCGADETIRLWDPGTGRCLQTWQVPGPYAGMRIAGVTGISEAQRTALRALGAVE